MGRAADDSIQWRAAPQRRGASGRRWAWVAAVAAGLGIWLQETATPWLMSGMTADPRLIAGVHAATMLAVSAAVVVAGAVVDLVPAARLLRAAHVALAAVSLVIAVVVLADAVGPALLLLLATAMGLGHGVLIAGWPTLAGAGFGGVPAAAVRSAHHWGGRTLGGPVAGLVIACVGISAAFCVDAFAFLAVALSLRQMPSPGSLAPVSLTRLGSAVRAGLHTASLTPSVRHALVCGAAGAFGISGLWALLVVVARGGLGLGPVGFGLLQASAGAGAVCGVVLVLKSSRRRASAATVMRCLLALGGCAVVAASAQGAVVPVAIGVFAAGLAWVGCVVVVVAVLQAAVPADAEGRAVGVGLAALYLSTALGSAWWGHVASWLGVPAALASAGAITLVAAVVSAGLRMGRLPPP